MSKTNIQILGEEKDKIYRLNRRLDALTELLEKVNNGTLSINTYDIINADTLVIVKSAVAKFEEVYA